MPIQQITSGIIANNAVVVADIADSTITGAKLAANTLANSVFQTGSVENYSRAVGLLGMRNRIINGAQVIDQRNAGASVALSSTTTFITDRWKARINTGSGTTGIQSSTAPAGFKNSLLITIGTGGTPSASDNNWFIQPIEGYNIADLSWGTADAKTVTVSFWVRSSLTGTFAVTLRNDASNRSYPATYTISSANTWEQKTITIAGETSGTWLSTNGTGIEVMFDLGTGSTYAGTANTWGNADYRTATGATKLVATSGATLYITGVQLEVGSSATGFEYVNYQTSLANCQRYYQKQGGAAYNSFGNGMAGSTTTCVITTIFPVPMRSSPTFAYSGTIGINDGQSSAGSVSSVSSTQLGNFGGYINFNSSGLTQFRPYYARADNDTTAFVSYSAEL